VVLSSIELVSQLVSYYSYRVEQNRTKQSRTVLGHQRMVIGMLFLFAINEMGLAPFC
jgi:hypothetical protein